MLPHYLAKFRSWNFGISGRKCRGKRNILWFLNTHPILMHLTYLLTCFNFRFLLIFLVNSGWFYLNVLWTEAAFSACLAWHWPDHHWQCNWRVSWTSSRTYAGKRQTLRATVTMFSYDKRHCCFCPIWHDFLDCFFKLPQFHTSNFRKVVRQHTEDMVGILHAFCWKFTWLSVVK